MLHESKLQRRGGFGFAPAGGVADQTLLSVATDYENTVSRRMTAIDPGELSRRFPGGGEVLQTVKYDGEGVFLYFEKGREAFVYNAPSGRVRVGFPALAEAATKLGKAGVSKGLFRAELYLPGMAADGRRLGIADVIRSSFSGTEQEVGSFRLAMLDAIMLDGRDLRPQQGDFGKTWGQLEEWFGSQGGLCHRMEGEVVEEGRLLALFEAAIGAGAEGIVVRRLNRPEIIKTKPLRTVDAVVIGYVEGDFEGQYGVASLLTALTYPEGGGSRWLQVFARVGAGLSDEQRTTLLPRLQAARVEAPLAMTDSDGRTIQFVKPEWIVELAGEDLLASSGQSENRTQVFEWEGGVLAYRGLLPLPRLSFARFLRFRDDKGLAEGGARIGQVVDAPSKPSCEPVEGTVAEILRREVFVKGTDMLRKLVVARRAPAADAFPYVIFWTDYSSKRAEPLKVEQFVAESEVRAEAIAAKLIAENVTRGFLPMSGGEPVAGGEKPAEPPAKPKRKPRKA